MRMRHRPTVVHRYYKESKREVLFDKTYNKGQGEQVVRAIVTKMSEKGYHLSRDYRIERIYPDRVYIGIPYRHGEIGKVDKAIKESIRELSTKVVV